MDLAQLTPTQRQIFEELKAPAELPSFDAGLRHELRAELEEGLAGLAGLLGPEDRLWVNKHALAQVHGCEARFVGDRAEPFAWSPALARGTVTHKAVELRLSWRGEPGPLALVDEALARCEQRDGSLAEWLATCGEGDRAELRALAAELVAKFGETFPPLERTWTPVTESACRAELLDQRVVLQGRVDLTLGQARGTTARKVLVDLKTGGFATAHIDDLRFYALLETLRAGVPPRLLASCYLDTGHLQTERVTEGLLRAALRRAVDGTVRLAELLHGGEAPARRAGPACRWCAHRPGCDEGQAWLRGQDDEP